MRKLQRRGSRRRGGKFVRRDFERAGGNAPHAAELAEIRPPTHMAFLGLQSCVSPRRGRRRRRCRAGTRNGGTRSSGIIVAASAIRLPDRLRVFLGNERARDADADAPVQHGDVPLRRLVVDVREGHARLVVAGLERTGRLSLSRTAAVARRNRKPAHGERRGIVGRHAQRHGNGGPAPIFGNGNLANPFPRTRKTVAPVAIGNVGLAGENDRIFRRCPRRPRRRRKRREIKAEVRRFLLHVLSLSSCSSFFSRGNGIPFPLPRDASNTEPLPKSTEEL